MKAIRIRLSDADGKLYHWTITRVPRVYNVTLGHGRVISGWEYTDQDGYARFSEGTWIDMVPRFKATVENYGLRLESEAQLKGLVRR